MANRFFESPWLSLATTTVFAHGLGDVPSLVQLQYNNNGTVVIFGDGSHINSIDSVNIVIDFSGLLLDVDHTLKIIAIRKGFSLPENDIIGVGAGTSAGYTVDGITNTSGGQILNVRAVKLIGADSVAYADNTSLLNSKVIGLLLQTL